MNTATTPEAPPILVLDEITKAYPGVVANDRVKIDLKEGEIHAIVGENGAGKTTLVGTLFGLNRPDSGRILLDGEPIEVTSPRTALENGFGYVQQHFSLIPTLTVAENVVLALRGSDQAIGLAQGAARVEELGERLGLNLDPGAVIEELTVGEQQRAELLKALARETRILALDEPNALLTPQEWLGLEGVLRRLAESGVGLFLISHKLDEVVRLADRISVMRRGKLVATLVAGETNVEDLARLMVGDLDFTQPSGAREAGRSTQEVKLEVKDLCVRGDRGEQAVTDVSFVARAGEILGIAGVEGSGQVELTESLSGARRGLSGSVILGGEEIGSEDVKRRMDRGIGHVPADRRSSGLVGTLSVAENIVLPIVSSAPFSRGGLKRNSEIRRHAIDLIERFDIRVSGPDVLTDKLSGGNQQKVILARELSRPIEALICCYPTWGLDLASVASVQRQILELRDQGAAIIYASVELDELLAITDRILVLHRGRAAGEVVTAETSAEQLGLLMGGQAA
ncbi:MAG: ABC transporter ATP-binding protein [Thermoleophilia bacterium]|nr:ABC transporter ATP-binding protein [Thermoleophilia bacterium]